MIAHELAATNQQLKEQLADTDNKIAMTTKVTIAATLKQEIVRQQTRPTQITVEIVTAVTNPVGKEDLLHWDIMDKDDWEEHFNHFAHAPSTFAKWCAATRADEGLPCNHNALLRAIDDNEMKHFSNGLWATDTRENVLLRLITADKERMSEELERFEDPFRPPEPGSLAQMACDFRLHFLTATVNQALLARNMTVLKPIMDAMARPLVELTNKFYTEPIIEEGNTSDIANMLQQCDRMQQDFHATRGKAIEEANRQFADSTAKIQLMRADFLKMTRTN